MPIDVMSWDEGSVIVRVDARSSPGGPWTGRIAARVACSPRFVNMVTSRPCVFSVGQEAGSLVVPCFIHRNELICCLSASGGGSHATALPSATDHPTDAGTVAAASFANRKATRLCCGSTADTLPRIFPCVCTSMTLLHF